ncbi:RDD family protein [Bacteriovorax sp. BSW11_IV]|nr:RDD family protein [Bacteriovorax sp. BSW11_IV]
MKQKEKVVITETKKTVLAPISKVFASWVVDFACIAALMGLLTFSFIFTVNISFAEFMTQMKVSDMAIFGVLFSILYVSYFSILDLAQTPGKILLGVKVDSADRSLTFKATLIRAIVSMISTLLIGLPALLDFSGKLSDTRVILND